MDKKLVPIKYTSRDFNAIKQDLVEYAKRYYPDSYKDFSEAGFGALMTDMVAYVGDILSFYMDYQTNESYLDTSVEYNNIVRHGESLGHKFTTNPSSHGIVDIYVLIPANANGIGVDIDYYPIMRKGSTFRTSTGNSFVLLNDIDFNAVGVETTVARVSTTTGAPTYYALRAKGVVVSGAVARASITVGDFERFKKVRVPGSNIAEILSVSDSDGRDYFEVRYLSQDVVYVPAVNRGADKSTVTSVLKPVVVPRRFVVKRELGDLYLQFGHGSEASLTTDTIKDPSEVVLQKHGKNYVTDAEFDPWNLLSTEQLGISPSSTTLEIAYRVNTSGNVNAAAGSINSVSDAKLDFPAAVEGAVLAPGHISIIINSIEVSNVDPVLGDISLPTPQELKFRIQNSFAAQSRAVTDKDYESVIYNMPPEYGAVKRVKIVQDKDSFKRNLNIYILSENFDTTFATSTSTLKNNLKVWLAQYKMINDTIDILDGHIINLGVEFELIAKENNNKHRVHNLAIATLKNKLAQKMYIGEPLVITDIYQALNRVDGVSDTTKVRIFKKDGTSYSSNLFDVDSNFTSDGRMLQCPKNAVFEFKFPDADIIGAVK